MAGVLLALFPLLLMFNTRLAWIALATAIVILCHKRLTAAPPRRRRPAEYDTNV